MVCVVGPTVKLCVTGVAACKLAFPAWLGYDPNTKPPPTMVTVLPLVPLVVADPMS